jgi:hypothetical protein
VTSVSCLKVMSVLFPNRDSTVLLATGADNRVVVERTRLRDRLAAHWHARRLDRALAAGIPPEGSAALALRAQRLTEQHRRWSIADALRRIVREADDDRRPSLGRVTPDRPAVKAASEALNRLADTLEAPGPVAAHGVAQAWLLLTDATGPLYDPHSRAPLCHRATEATKRLRPWPT